MNGSVERICIRYVVELRDKSIAPINIMLHVSLCQRILNFSRQSLGKGFISPVIIIIYLVSTRVVIVYCIKMYFFHSECIL